MGYAAEGLLGAVMGASASAVHSIDDNKKKADEIEMERRKEEMLLRREQYLAKMREAEKDRDARRKLDNMPEEQRIQTEGEVARRGQTDPLDVKKSEDTARATKRVEADSLKQDVQRAGLIEGARSNAGIAADTTRQENAGRIQRENDLARASHETYIDDKGNYRRKSDNEIVTTEIREGGKLLGKEAVKAPDSKVNREQRTDEDRIKAIEREIEQIAKKDFKDAGDERRLKELREALVKLDPKMSVANPGVGRGAAPKPWERYQGPSRG